MQSKIHFLATLLGKVPYYQENHHALVIEFVKSLKKFGTPLLILFFKRKCQCYVPITRKPSNMVKAREQSKPFVTFVMFNIDQITL